ncbi:peroxiredoxin-like family protein [Acidothermaceae bacterium B102]|nr:peroxiredoxin-like family protein [Acidothermaceae bacterium B102]
MSRTITAGTVLAPRVLTTVTGASIAIPDPDRLIHLQFRRYAGCPVCNLHLRTVTGRLGEIEAAGIREVVVFHSTLAELLEYESALPFDVIADPGKALYREFGVESSLRAVFNPRGAAAVPAVMANLARSLPGGQRRLPPVRHTGGNLGLPADLLIDSAGRVVAVKYGQHAYDQWSVDELLEQLPGVGVSGA